MDNEIKRTSKGKWSVGIALFSIILISLLLLWLIAASHVSGEGGLAAVGIIGIIIYFTSYFIIIISFIGIILGIIAIRKTFWRQGLTGLLLNIALMVISVSFLLWFHISLFLSK
jgi:peptidoglycan biosynthesis protein MviN/MurJ (putative lipid II flippase)